MLVPRRSLGIALTVVCVPLHFSACDTETFEPSPDEITGLWSTSHPDYADRAFEITPGRLYLLQGGDTISAHDIERVRLSHDDLPFYSIGYTGDEDELFTFRFYLSQAQGGTIYFPNQSELIWHRAHKADARASTDAS